MFAARCCPPGAGENVSGIGVPGQGFGIRSGPRTGLAEFGHCVARIRAGRVPQNCSRTIAEIVAEGTKF